MIPMVLSEMTILFVLAGVFGVVFIHAVGVVLALDARPEADDE